MILLNQGIGTSVPEKGEKQHSVNIQHQLKSKLGWPVCTKSMKLE